MREVLSFIFNKIIDPLTLPISPLYEWLILAVVGVIAFKIAYRVVGDMYDMGILSGSTSGSICHWIIRVVAFIPIWAALYGIIVLAQWIMAHWVLALCIFIGLILGGSAIYFILKRRSNKEVPV